MQIIQFLAIQIAIPLGLVALLHFKIGKYPQPLPIEENKRKGIWETLILLALSVIVTIMIIFSGFIEKMAEYPIKLEVKYEEKASRLEALIIRWLYAIVLGIVLGIWGAFAVLAMIGQWIVILVNGARNRGLHDFVTKYFTFYTKCYGYMYLLTDERPPIGGW